MDVRLDGDHVVVEAKGPELLRLRAKLYKRLGSLVRNSKGQLAFPRAALSTVSDLLDLAEDTAGGLLCDDLRSVDEHRVGRETALGRLRDGAVEGVDERWLSTLDPPQAVAVSVMVTPGIRGLCLFDEQGSGKTVMAIAAFDILRRSHRVDSMLVVCPKSMTSEWPKDLGKFVGDDCGVTVLGGTASERISAATKSTPILIGNYEAVAAVQPFLAERAKRERMLLVVDESYYVKNASAQRTCALMELRRHCVLCFVLCGTPAPNNHYDLVAQFNLADLGYTFSAFTPSVEADADRLKIQELVEDRGLFIRRLKSEILATVPEKHFEIIRVQLVGRQASMYERARDQLVLELKTLTNVTFKKQLSTYFKKRSALLQICTCPAAIDPTMADVSAKIPVLETLVRRLIREGRKVIVWSYYRRSLEELSEVFRDLSPVRVDGAASTAERRSAVKMFQDDPGTMLFIGNPAAAGAGITLHAASDAIYLSYSNQAAHYLQSLDRIHRRGQRSSVVNYYLFACADTIEEREIKRLRQKEVRQHELLGDNVKWPNSLDEALEELS